MEMGKPSKKGLEADVYISLIFYLFNKYIYKY